MKSEQEQTAKVWKAIQLVGVLLIVGGFTWGFVAWQARETGQISRSEAWAIIEQAAATAVGAVAWTVGRVGGWWFHG